MKRIEIKVLEETAEKWRMATPEKRERISQKINVQLARELLQGQKEELKKVMGKISQTARTNGITEEILAEILAEDE